MKILIDTIYTSKPATCASAYKMRTIVNYLLETRPDIYFRWLVPNWAMEIEGTKEWLPDNPRVEYIECNSFKDRHKEYNYIRPEWTESFMYRGDYWDTDIVITNRTPLVPIMRLNLHKPGQNTYRWSRRIMIIEDMPVMSFKGSIGMPDIDTQNRQTISGYLAADATALCAYWEVQEVMKIARTHYSASTMQQLSKTMHEATPVIIDSVSLKKKAFVTDNAINFTIGFAGRMVAGMNFASIFEVMKNHWIYRAGRDRGIECVISTVSKSEARVKDIPKFVTIKRLGREDFWDLMKTKVHVGIFMSPEEDYSMSLIEPLVLGTPYVVYECKWSVASLGKDYPFFCKNELEAYHLIREFYNNYSAMYMKFAKWSKDVFLPILMKRNEISILSVVDTLIMEYNKDLAIYSKKERKTKDVIALLVSKTTSKGFLDMKRALLELQKEGKVDILGNKMDKKFQEAISVSFSTDFNEFRLLLMAIGYRDASLKVGHLRI